MSPTQPLALRDLTMLELTGGRLSLDFINTVGAWVPEVERDYLKRYEDLVSWAVYVGSMAEDEALALLRAAAAAPEAAAQVLAGALDLRRSLRRLHLARLEGDALPQPDLDRLNAALADTLPHRQLESTGDRLAWAWGGPADALDRVLWPVAFDAAELLTSPLMERVRECPAPDCGWLFVDMSKNRSRRWCSMETCGNQAKARRHYQRQKRQAE